MSYITYAPTAWTICLTDVAASIANSTTFTPNASSNYLKLPCIDYSDNGKRLSQTKQMAARNSMNPKTGKQSTQVTISCRIVKVSASIYTDFINIKKLLDKWRNAGQSPIWLYAVFLDGSTYYYEPFLAANGTTYNDYEKGYVDDYSLKIERGKIINLTITFGECLQ